VLFTPTALVAALLLALLLTNRRLIGRGFFRTALFLPFIVSLAVAAFAWTYLLDPQVGLLNFWLRSVGIQLGNVLQDPALAMPTVVLVAIWKNFGFYMVIFIAGLQEIPESLYEAAKIDGAGAWRRFVSVTLPQLSNTLAFVVVFAMIAALQAFDQIYVMTGGGPYRSTQTVVMEIYQEGFKKLDLGLATALSYVLLLATLILSLIQFRFFGRREKDIA
jgi:multiple sugar transport system permease protein